MMATRAEQQRKYRVAKKRHMVRVLTMAKLVCGCAECGYAEDGDALQLDHIEPLLRKTNGVKRVRGRIAQGSWSTLWADFFDPNIQVLCANCHAIKSARQTRKV